MTIQRSLLASESESACKAESTYALSRTTWVSYTVPTLDVFLSWSGQRSRLVAEALRVVLPTVVIGSKPWMSTNGIAPGQRWSQEIGAQLENVNFGIICVTPENQSEVWLNFEAGALSKSLSEGIVVPYLFGLGPSDLMPGPLTQFQGLQATKADTEKLFRSIHDRQGGPTTYEVFGTLFERAWPDLEGGFEKIRRSEQTTRVPIRDESAKVDEILGLVRALARVLVPQMGTSRVPSKRDLWNEVLQQGGPRLRAILRSARVQVYAPPGVVRVSYDKDHEFHEAQARKNLEQLSRFVQQVYGAGYQIEVVQSSENGPRFEALARPSEDEADDDEFPPEDELPF